MKRLLCICVGVLLVWSCTPSNDDADDEPGEYGAEYDIGEDGDQQSSSSSESVVRSAGDQLTGSEPEPISRERAPGPVLYGEDQICDQDWCPCWTRPGDPDQDDRWICSPGIDSGADLCGWERDEVTYAMTTFRNSLCSSPGSGWGCSYRSVVTSKNTNITRIIQRVLDRGCYA